MGFYKLKDLPEEEKPRERLKKYGEEALSSNELIAILIQTGNKQESVLQLAQRIIAHFGNLEKLAEASLEELQKVKGVGFAKACKIKAAFELGKRALNKKSNLKKISHPKDIFELLKNEVATKKKEYFKLICLNTRNQIIAIENISIGTLNSALAHPREIFYSAIKNLANSIIVVHNHPSGDPSPSTQDIEITKKLQKAGDLLGIELTDHIIITKDNYFSFKQKGLL